MWVSDSNNFGSPLSEISRLYDLQLGVFDMGWPAAAAVAYNTAVGALIIPICLGVNFLLLITKCTRTVNIDLAHGEYRPVELLALRLHRCGGLFRNGSVVGMGLLRCDRLLYHHVGDGGSDRLEVPGLL